MLHLIARLILVPLGFILSALAGTFVLVTLGSERIIHALQGAPDAQEIQLETIFEVSVQAVALTSAITIVPALLVVVIGEIARLRSIVYYIAGGGVALGCIPFLAQLSGGPGDAGFEVSAGALWPVFATAGFFGGLTYWLIAGRKA